jgi:phage terminase large subunit
LWRKAEGDKNLQKQVLEECEHDIVGWVNNWCWTYDPRELPSTLPFSLFEKQEEFIGWLSKLEEDQQEGIAEKCRDVGFTWLCAAYALHRWLFRKGASIGFGSRKLELVDKIGDPDSILEKIRILLRNLPKWMLPEGFKWNEHDNFCKLINPATGSTITGEGGDNIGRGGRKTIYFIDEAAFLERPQKVEAALSQNARVKVWVSTPNGTGNAFYKKRFSGKFPVFRFEWLDDNRKNHFIVYDADGNEVERGNGRMARAPEGGRVEYPWYEDQKNKLDPVVLAQEVDIDYSASVEGVCIPAKWVQAAIDFDAYVGSCWISDAVAGLDIGEEGADPSVLTVRHSFVVTQIIEWGHLLTSQTAHRAADEAEKYAAEMGRPITQLHYDVSGVGVGVKSTFKTSDRELPFRTNPVNGGEGPSERVFADGKSAKELFLNLRAELWWSLRMRFEKTYEYRVLGIPHPLDECISIPNHGQLIADLSLPLTEKTEAGKIKLESKPAMRKRGVKSPHYGDSLAYCFAPGKKRARSA